MYQNKWYKSDILFEEASVKNFTLSNYNLLLESSFILQSINIQ